MDKLISIIIPVYNAKEYIKECAKSIVNEITEQMEVIFIDDGSTDNSEDIYNKYKNIKDVKIIKQRNHGVSYTRNKGIDEAAGKYIMFVDADDYLKKGWSKILLSNIEEEDEYIIFSRKLQKKTYEKEEILKACLGIGKDELNNSHIMSPCSKIYRTELIKRNNIKFDENVINGEDMLFNFETIIKAKNIKLINESIYIYRKNMQSTTNSFNKKAVESEVAFHNKLHKIIERKLDDIWKEYEQYITLNGVYICFWNYALGGNRDYFNKLVKLIEENREYKEVIEKSKCNKNKKIFFYLVRTKKYRLAILYVKIKKYSKKIFYTLNKQNVVEEL